MLNDRIFWILNFMTASQDMNRATQSFSRPIGANVRYLAGNLNLCRPAYAAYAQFETMNS